MRKCNDHQTACPESFVVYSEIFQSSPCFVCFISCEVYPILHIYISSRSQKEEALNFRVAKANEVMQLEKVHCL